MACAAAPLTRTIMRAAGPAALLIATMESPVFMPGGRIVSPAKTRRGTAPAVPLPGFRMTAVPLCLDGDARRGGVAAPPAFVVQDGAGERLVQVVARLPVLGDVQAVVLL